MNANDVIQEIFHSNTHADAYYFTDDPSLNTDSAHIVSIYISPPRPCVIDYHKKYIQKFLTNNPFRFETSN